MRIDPYNQISQIYQTSKKTNVSRTSSAGELDKVEISQFGKDYQVARQAVADASDIRADKVDQMKKQLEAGNYDVSAEDFAAKLAQKYGTTL